MQYSTLDDAYTDIDICLFVYCFTSSRYSRNKVHTDTHRHFVCFIASQLHATAVIRYTHIPTHTDTHKNHIHIYADYPLRPRLCPYPCLPTPASMHTVHHLSSMSLPKPPALR